MNAPLYRLLSLGVLLAVLSSSCVRYRDLVNFNETTLPEDVERAIVDSEPIVIQTSDLLRITVSGLDPLAVAPFNLDAQNLGGGGQGQGSQQTQSIELFSGYLVDANGFVDFPVLGRISAAGKTLEALKDDIRERLSIYLKDPVVNIRYLNFKVTVLGSVAAPGRYSVTNPRFTLLQAIGTAGDLTDYANRDSILIIRERNGKRSFEHINLHTDEIFKSEYYFLEQNDVVYVPPVRTRVATVQDRGQRFVQYGTATLSLAAFLFAIFRK